MRGILRRHLEPPSLGAAFLVGLSCCTLPAAWQDLPQRVPAAAVVRRSDDHGHSHHQLEGPEQAQLPIASPANTVIAPPAGSIAFQGQEPVLWTQPTLDTSVEPGTPLVLREAAQRAFPPKILS